VKGNHGLIMLLDALDIIESTLQKDDGSSIFLFQYYTHYSIGTRCLSTCWLLQEPGVIVLWQKEKEKEREREREGPNTIPKKH
jgi:hypothetical protein